MNFKSILMLALMSALFAGCNGSPNKTKTASDDNAFAKNVPDDLVMPEIPPTAKPTKTLIQQLKKKYAVAPKMTVPSLDLVFPSKSESPDSIAQREQELKNRDYLAWTLMNEMRAKCKLQHFELRNTVILPQDPSLETLDRGDQIDVNLGAGIKSANAQSDCPLMASAGAKYNAEVTQNNAESINGNGSMGGSISMTVANHAYAELLGTRGFVFSPEVSSAIISRKLVVGKDDSIFFQYGVSGAYLSNQGDIKFDSKVKALGRDTGKSNANAKVLVDVLFNFPEASIRVTALGSIDHGLNFNKILLNGNPSTIDELQDIFGMAKQVSLVDVQLRPFFDHKMH